MSSHCIDEGVQQIVLMAERLPQLRHLGLQSGVGVLDRLDLQVLEVSSVV